MTHSRSALTAKRRPREQAHRRGQRFGFWLWFLQAGPARGEMGYAA